jgi:hypothetical protein
MYLEITSYVKVKCIDNPPPADKIHLKSLIGVTMTFLADTFNIG